MSDVPSSTADLFDRQREARNAWEELIHSVPSRRIDEPGVSGALSVKDIVAHLAAWERHATERLRALARGEAPTPLSKASWAEYEHAFNERVFREWRYRSWDEVRAEAADAYAEFVASAEKLSDPVLFGDERAWQIVAFNGYLHYLDFADAIRAWLGRKADVGTAE